MRFDVVTSFSLDSMRCWAEQALAPAVEREMTQAQKDYLAGWEA